jgi:hypothetical protein
MALRVARRPGSVKVRGVLKTNDLDYVEVIPRKTPNRRIIDRRQDRYYERIVHPESGKTIEDIGSAKRSTKQD